MTTDYEWLDILKRQTTCTEGDFSSAEGASAWQAYDGMAIGFSEVAFLYGLVVLAKPQLVLEGGAGRSTAAIAAGLEANGAGFLHSYEPEARHAVNATRRLEDLGLATRANVHESKDGTLSWRGDRPDMVFLDSDAPIRAREIVHWERKEVLIVIHDSRGSHATPEMPPGGVDIDCPRGLWLADNRPKRFPRQ